MMNRKEQLRKDIIRKKEKMKKMINMVITENTIQTSSE